MAKTKRQISNQRWLYRTLIYVVIICLVSFLAFMQNVQLTDTVPKFVIWVIMCAAAWYCARHILNVLRIFRVMWKRARNNRRQES